MNETESTTQQNINQLDQRADRLINAIPFFQSFTDSIDSRNIFIKGMNSFLRLSSIISLFVGSLVLLIAAFNALTVEGGRFDGTTKFFASVVDLSMFFVLVGGVIIVLKRSQQIKENQEASVIDIAFSVIRISIEVSALYFAFIMLITGMLTVLLGADAAQVMFLSLSYSIPEAISTITPTGSSAFWVRLGGLFTIIGSIFVGFFALFSGYVGHDLLHIVYRFFARK
ncbi:MAG: hypothetical protein CL916_05665 [Deltaproteobacteria bacterium]|nr:hypothetical protein [Deltaproteobacteria bacterium]